MLGIGAGDYPEEARASGCRSRRSASGSRSSRRRCRPACGCGTGEQGDERPFHGKHVRMERPLNVPQSLSRPHPPILIAGSGERRTLPLVARYADACNIPPSPGPAAQARAPATAVRPGRAATTTRSRRLPRSASTSGRMERRSESCRPAALAGGPGHRDGLWLGRRHGADHAD